MTAGPIFQGSPFIDTDFTAHYWELAVSALQTSNQSIDQTLISATKPTVNIQKKQWQLKHDSPHNPMHVFLKVNPVMFSGAYAEVLKCVEDCSLTAQIYGLLVIMEVAFCQL